MFSTSQLTFGMGNGWYLDRLIYYKKNDAKFDNLTTTVNLVVILNVECSKQTCHGFK